MIYLLCGTLYFTIYPLHIYWLLLERPWCAGWKKYFLTGIFCQKIQKMTKVSHFLQPSKLNRFLHFQMFIFESAILCLFSYIFVLSAENQNQTANLKLPKSSYYSILAKAFHRVWNSSSWSNNDIIIVSYLDSQNTIRAWYFLVKI